MDWHCFCNTNERRIELRLIANPSIEGQAVKSVSLTRIEMAIIHKYALVLLLLCSNILFGSDACYGKMQQSTSNDNWLDPFADNYKPTGNTKPNWDQAESDGPIDPFESLNPKAGAPGSTGVIHSSENGRAKSSIHEELRAAGSPSSKARPTWPERTQPGGLVSSTSTDPLMNSKQEAILLQRLFAYDDSDWNVRSLDRLVYELNQTIPVFLDMDELETENVDPRGDIKIASPPGPLAARLDDVLKPLGLTIVCRRCRIEITTKASIVDSEGTTRIYDVSPLVFGVRDGLEQLTNNIEYSIDPDSWINNGGNSVISPNIIADGSVPVTTLIISAPTLCHLRIQCLLDRLNSLTSNSNYRPSGPSNGNPVNLANDNLNTPNRRRFDDRIAPKNPF